MMKLLLFIIYFLKHYYQQQLPFLYIIIIYLLPKYVCLYNFYYYLDICVVFRAELPTYNGYKHNAWFYGQFPTNM